MHALLALGPTGLALIGAVSFTVPGMFTVLLLCVTAAAVWYAEGHAAQYQAGYFQARAAQVDVFHRDLRVIGKLI